MRALPRRSACIKFPTKLQGSVYGNRPFTSIQKDTLSTWKGITNEPGKLPNWSNNRVPEPISDDQIHQSPTSPTPMDEEEDDPSPNPMDQDDDNPSIPMEEDQNDMSDIEEMLTILTQEGGVKYMDYLLSNATELYGMQSSSYDNVREWTYKQILQRPKNEIPLWQNACRTELQSLKERDVFEVVTLPKGRKAIKSRWVFDVKSDGRKKARLVAKGFSQREGVDYNELFSPVVRFETVRLLLALAALEDWEIQALDVKTAFLYGALDEEIYMEQPEGFVTDSSKVWRLRKALYGLKQASRAWWYQCTESMKRLGFKRCSSDAGVYVFRNKTGKVIIAVIYVDDALFMGNDKPLLLELKEKFKKIWECRDLGEPKEFLRMRITRDRKARKIVIEQRDYLEKIIRKFGMLNAAPAATPLPSGYNPTKNNSLVDPILRQRYQSVIGSLLYLALGTRPDISFAVIKMSQFGVNPSQEHLKKALHIIKYLVGTRSYELVYDGKSDEGPVAFADSDWATDTDDRKSQTGYLIKLASAPVCWVSQKQKTVALSSTEAEYMALSDCTRQIKWIKTLLFELGFPIKSIPCVSDNQGAIFLSSNEVSEKRTKHIDIRFHFIRGAVADKDVVIYYAPTADQPADVLTKNLAKVKFEKFRQALGLVLH